MEAGKLITNLEMLSNEYHAYGYLCLTNIFNESLKFQVRSGPSVNLEKP